MGASLFYSNPCTKEVTRDHRRRSCNPVSGRAPRHSRKSQRHPPRGSGFKRELIRIANSMG